MHNPAPLSLQSLRRIDDVCTRFEALASSGDLQIEPWLEGFDGVQRERLLFELVILDIELRQSRGLQPREADYLHFANPADVDQARAAFRQTMERLSADELIAVRSRRYHFINQIGEGGIGSVWRVYDTHTRRPLAIKLLHDRFRNDPAANQRLRREALLTGTLQHPGVPPVYDSGMLADQRTFFAMKLVEGETFMNLLGRDTDADQASHHIGIFEQIAQTIAYAHSQGVIHRDLKPQNVMVGQFGEVQVMDWGMAKRIDSNAADFDFAVADPGTQSSASPSKDDTVSRSLDSSLNLHGTVQRADEEGDDEQVFLTSAGEVLGTPRYMPPEQARGEIARLDARCDVFSLGAILFEILTHRQIYSGDTVTDVLSRAARGDLGDSIQQLQSPGIDAELREICLHCLQVDPEERPASAGVIADSISKYSGRVQQRLKEVEIERSAAVVRLQEEKKRRRVFVLMSSLVAAVLVAGVVGVATQWFAAESAHDLAVKAQGEAETANTKSLASLELADQRFRQAQHVVDDFLTEVSSPDGDLARTPGTKQLQRELLAKARDYYEQFLKEAQNDPSLQYQSANALARLGKIAQTIEPASEEVIRLFELAASRYQVLMENASSNPDYRRKLAECLASKGNGHAARSEFDPAITSFESAIAQLEPLIAEHENDDDALLLAKTNYNLAEAHVKKRENATATDYYLAGLQESDRLLQTHGDDPRFLFQIGLVYSGAGVHDGFRLRNWKEGLKKIEYAVSLWEHCNEIDPEFHVYQNALAVGLNNVGLALHMNRRREESLAAFNRAAGIREKLVRENPSIPQYAGELAATYTNLGTRNAFADEKELSAQYYQKAIDTLNALAFQHPSLFEYSNQYIGVLGALANLNPHHQRADNAIIELIKIRRQMLSVRPDSASFSAELALLLCLQSEHPNDECVRLTEAITDDGKYNAKLRAIRALVLYRSGDYGAARVLVESIPEKERSDLVAVVDTLVTWKTSSDAARSKMEAVSAALATQQYPEFDVVRLLTEAQALADNQTLDKLEAKTTLTGAGGADLDR